MLGKAWDQVVHTPWYKWNIATSEEANTNEENSKEENSKEENSKNPICLIYQIMPINFLPHYLLIIMKQKLIIKLTTYHNPLFVRITNNNSEGYISENNSLKEILNKKNDKFIKYNIFSLFN